MKHGKISNVQLLCPIDPSNLCFFFCDLLFVSSNMVFLFYNIKFFTCNLTLKEHILEFAVIHYFPVFFFNSIGSHYNIYIYSQQYHIFREMTTWKFIFSSKFETLQMKIFLWENKKNIINNNIIQFYQCET